MSNLPSEQIKYFDLHTHGVGYVNRLREVPVKRGEPFMALTIAALHGAEDAVEYTYFDCRISGTEAIKQMKRCQQASDQDKTILIGFKLGDLFAEPFTYKSGEKEGQTGVSLKARLLFVNWIKVDGETVYTAPPKEEASSSNPTANSEEAA